MFEPQPKKKKLSFDAVVYIHGHGDLEDTDVEDSKKRRSSILQTNIFLADFGNMGALSPDFITMDLNGFMKECLTMSPQNACSAGLRLVKERVKSFEEFVPFLSSKGHCSPASKEYMNRIWEFNPDDDVYIHEGIYLLVRGAEPVKIFSPQGIETYDKQTLMEHLEQNYDLTQVLIVDASCLNGECSLSIDKLSQIPWGGTRKRKMRKNKKVIYAVKRKIATRKSK